MVDTKEKREIMMIKSHYKNLKRDEISEKNQCVERLKEEVQETQIKTNYCSYLILLAVIERDLLTKKSK